MVRGDLNSLNRKINQLIIIDVHARDIIDDRDLVGRARVRLGEPAVVHVVQKDDDIKINQCTGTLGYEYMGLTADS